jgi:hypothetical protein
MWASLFSSRLINGGEWMMRRLPSTPSASFDNAACGKDAGHRANDTCSKRRHAGKTKPAIFMPQRAFKFERRFACLRVSGLIEAIWP